MALHLHKPDMLYGSLVANCEEMSVEVNVIMHVSGGTEAALASIQAPSCEQIEKSSAMIPLYIYSEYSLLSSSVFDF